ncbi:MAG: non-ribosomal peptide synthetase [Polaromonas sp.]|nr:non-ribosomal peptide synthetase [Polaromonas sp.]
MSHNALEPVEFDPFAGEALERVIPTSEAQREVWLADQLGLQASLAFNESVKLRLDGPLDITALQGALNALVMRHEALRSTFGPDGTDMLVSAAGSVSLPVADLRALSPEERQQQLHQAAVEAVETPFSLEQGPLFRARLLRMGDAEHLLLMTAHHIVCDGWSWGLIAEDLGALYAEQTGEAPGPDPAPSYADYVAWEAAQANTPEMAEHERFWLGCFTGTSLPSLDLPADRPRAPVRTFDSRRVDHWLDAELVGQVRQLGAKAGASVFATLFSGFAATLGRLSGQDDLVIGVPAAGQSASGINGLVGHCVNLLPVRTAVDPGMPFDAHVSRCGSALLDAFDHQTLTYGTLLQKLPVRRDPSRLPLVSVMFNVDQAVKGIQGAFPGLSAELSTNPRRFENFELFVNAAQENGGLRLECQYNTDLFDAATVERWMGAYEALLRAAVAQPGTAIGRLHWLTPAESARLRSLQPLHSPIPAEALMHSAFVRQAALSPDRIALREGDTLLTYQALDQRANQLARALRARGVARGALVGLCLNRSADMVVALLAVLKAGGTYIPLDPGFPPARLQYYAQDARLTLLVTASGITAAPLDWANDSAQRVLRLDIDTGWLSQPGDALATGPEDADPSDPAYIIYTSGSTGKPKGVCVPHRAVVNFLTSMQATPGIGPDDRLAAVTTLSFDIAVLELMLPLTVGAQVVMVPRETAMDGHLLASLLRSTGATLMQATPGMWRMLLDTPWHGGEGFKALVGGERLPPDLANDLLDRAGEVWNMYGPTETTVWSTVWPVTRAALKERGVSIGRPIGNTSVWIVNEALQPCPIGVPGEICIGGDGVALGYLERPELTADRFVPDPFSTEPGARLYRTGDRGRWCNDGLLEHLGRLDFQVKVRGYRIELGEIETACNELVSVAQSVALAREDQPGDVRLVAYLALGANAGFDEGALRAHLREKLPDYMLPQHVVVLDAIPLLPNGKVDRKALPPPAQDASATGRQRLAPRTPLEQQILNAMEQVLNLPGLGVLDDFFALGGHSLLAARLTARLNKALSIQLPLRTVFEAPTAEQLARAAQAATLNNAPRRPAIEHQASRREAPLTVMQERIRFMEELYPGRVVYNTPSAHRLTGPLERTAFEQALRQMLDRQPGLRSAIVRSASGPVQCVFDDVRLELPFEDLSPLAEEDRESELMRRLQAAIDQPIDITVAPLFRAALYRMAPDQHVFLFMPHHIIWDGWSFDLLYQEMASLYPASLAQRPAPLPAPSVSYLDFAHWHAQWMDSEECENQITFWKQRFGRVDILRPLPTDRPRSGGMSGVGAAEWVHVDEALTEQLRHTARACDATLNMLVMAIYAAMLSEALGSRSLVLGIPVRGRPISEVEPVMGFFNNLLPTPMVLDQDMSLKAWVGVVKRELLDSFAHQEVPFERLAVEPEIAAHANKAGLYQSLFSFQDARARERHWGPLEHRSVLVMQKGATEDFSLWLMEVPGGLEGAFNFNADLFDAGTARMFRERLVALLRRAVDAPSDTVSSLLAAPGDDTTQFTLWAQARQEQLKNTRSLARAAPPPASALGTTEAGMAAIWARLLGIEASQVRAQDNFFDIGGSSLLVMQAVAAAEKELGLVIDPRRFVTETLRSLSAGSERKAQLRRLWAELLDQDPAQIRDADNFFDLGGNSLLAMRAVTEAERLFGLKIDPRRYVNESLLQLSATATANPSAAGTDAPPAQQPQPSGMLSRFMGVLGRKK